MAMRHFTLQRVAGPACRPHRYLEDEMENKNTRFGRPASQRFDSSDWTLDNSSEGVPQQHNGSDCGAFCSTFCMHLSRGMALDFAQPDMGFFRRHIALSILHAKLVPE